MQTSLPATISIDLDDLWAYRRSFGHADADAAPSLWPLAVPRFAGLMQRLGVPGTVFVVGRDALEPVKASLLRELASAGHEIGNHSFDHHPQLHRWPAERQHDDLRRAHDAIVAACGVAPLGFRAPSFLLSPSLLDTVQRLGYRYDSSAFSNALAGVARRWQARRAVGAPSADEGHGQPQRWPLKPFDWQLSNGQQLLELPVTSLPLLRLPLHGSYLQHLADLASSVARAYAAAAVLACRHSGTPLHLLLHASDFIGADDGLPVQFLPGMRRPWRAKLALLEGLLQRTRSHFDCLTMASCAERVRASASAARSVPALQLG